MNSRQMILPQSPQSMPLTTMTTDSTNSTNSQWFAEALAEIEKLLCYTFRQPALLMEALTHPSSELTPTYQRLEFIGDAALGLAFANFLYLTNPGLGPGPLSTLRAANISTEKLARVAVRNRLYRLLRRNSAVLDQMVNEFTELVIAEGDIDLGSQSYGGNTLKAPKVLADIVESIAAAIYVDCNFNLEKFWKVIRGIMEPIITEEIVDEQPVTLLYQICQKNGKSISFKIWKNGSFNVANIYMEGELIGKGYSEQKVIAKLNAARDALQNLGANQAVAWFSTLSDIGEMDTDRYEGCKAKLKLNELCSKKHWQKPIYKVEKEVGPASGKKFICSVQVVVADNIFITLGDGKSRVRDAENAAAMKMLTEVLNES